MRNAIAAVLCLASAAAVAQDECAQALMDPDGEVPDNALEVLATPVCAAYREQALGMLEAWLLAEPAPPADGAEADDIAHLELERNELALVAIAMRLRQALERSDLKQARARLAAVATLRAEDPRLEDPQWRQPILDILDGRAAPPRPTSFDAKADWIRHPAQCGMAAWAQVFDSQVMPSPADAWQALGRPDLAIAQLLQDEWTEAIGLGFAPPRLRAHVEAFLGPGSYERELDVALRGLRMDHGLDGTRITLPLLGHALPLPVGYSTRLAEETTRFASPTGAEGYFRDMLLDREETDEAE